MPSALAIFTCRPNSHPFQERHVYLDEPVKIGRSVARCRPAQNNATFDCKVLSRNHALVWFDHKTGKFYLQDTKSSNGTFINSQRLSRGSEESPPCEIMSGDIIQFGVDVTENTRKGKVTHGCIVSTIKLFLPDGMEARLRSDVIHAPLPSPVDKVAANTPSMYSQELFQLSQYLQEALHREQMLEQKLATLQRLLAVTQEASDTSWQALIDEDRLLSRLEVMGNQLQACSKNQTEDSIRKELIALQEDKHNYETTAKESLRRVLQEKIEVVRKLSEVERSLSNTEDECTHLKEMNERTQEELRELANKYNGAVNEIKDLSDKLKVAEGRQEEIQQKGLAEKKELQHKIDEMEEREQELQAKIEALQADNDFTNERLTALQVRLEHLQEKTLKEHNSLGIQVDDFIPKINGSTEKEHFLSKSGGDCTFIHQFIECQNKIIDEGHLTKVEETKLLKENQARVKESNDLSDTLSPSKEKSSDDTTDAQMDDQDLNEPIAKVALLKALLEEERKAYRVQVEESNKQINALQAQLRRLQEEIENLRKEKENEISSTRNELVSAQNEILSLQQVAEKAASERDTDISTLQAELQTVRAELERWRKDASDYEKEIVDLQASFQLRCQQCEDQQKEEATRLKGELEKLKAEWLALEAECVKLRKENTLLTSELQRQEKELSSSQKQSLALTSDISVLEMSRKELENQMGSLREKHQRDAASLKTQLSEAESQAKDVQKEYERTQTVLSELKAKYEVAEQEKQSLTEELKQCKENLKLLQEKGNNRQWPWMPVMAALVAVTAVVLYPGLTRASP
ncbi:sarcolemmal membrane-associated protein isoform X20 [Chiroxiphia lanceolata]|uniref:sarcolemmal membrane-associated protein isoform X15 n=1 Tax=Manacus vitellinus TaxID=328815 RepID=UPI00084742B6|nr:sarcolemmal membrane-associated protein isoform X15 [Manacus vitellinus]XP_027496269.1 sarcolemmal membrane-associated protein isoform X16 [Corapipo altera]XP_027556796.1 sarcolemmal membrane-associated protein isoform X16 [Neopelma chrysocephalum]XP_032554476.1 sarcolemmal membrane-associated protein isoform X20 [Chiroxiphia lanceolata]XP_051667570.1 sarcolemmal membrane-associated protein isoform X20 [Manacus candei]